MYLLFFLYTKKEKNWINGFLYFAWREQMPVLCASQSTRTESLTCAFLLTFGQTVRSFWMFPAVWPQSRDGKRCVVWERPSFILSSGWHIAFSVKSAGRLSRTAVPSGPFYTRCAVPHKRRRITKLMSHPLPLAISAGWAPLNVCNLARCTAAATTAGLKTWVAALSE